MRLEDIIQLVRPEKVFGEADVEIETLACHPSEVTGTGTLFACMDEYLQYNSWQTWSSHLEALPSLPVAAVISPQPVPDIQVPQLVCADPRKAFGRAARLLSGFPERGLRLFGVTGTNGKTTTTRLLAHLLNRLEVSCGSIGTLGVELAPGKSLPGTYTTPLAHQLSGHLSAMWDEGRKAVALEVSSHGLALDRVEGLTFEGAILTNVERDHLDFHGSLEAYARAKTKLFGMVRKKGWCILNRDCPRFSAFAEASSGTVVSFGSAGSGADFELSQARFFPSGSRFSVRQDGREWRFHTQLAGPFQVNNCLGAIALLQSLGFPMQSISTALESFAPVPGRMEQFPMPNGSTAIVDYAHNPDGLQHLLEAARHLCPESLHVVFGCGGDRDRGKRPIMGALAAKLADFCWITSDNPRTEDPEAIIQDIREGIPGQTDRIHLETDREAAIRQAYAATGKGDLLIIAGKGHEDYQIVGQERLPFSDQAVLRALQSGA